MPENPQNQRRQMTALSRFHQSQRNPSKLSASDFTQTNGDANQRSLVAQFEAPKPFEFREQGFRLMLPYHEAFYHDGATGLAEQTYSLSYNAVDTPSVISSEVYADSTKLTEGSTVDSPGTDEYTIDYGTTTDALVIDHASDVTAHVFYFPEDGGRLEIEKEAPGSMGSVSQVIYDDITTDLFTRNQNRNPPSFVFNRSEYEGVVPQDWDVSIYVDAPYGVDWDDSDTDTTGSMTVAGVSPSIAVIDLPIEMGGANVENLGREVAQDIGNRQTG